MKFFRYSDVITHKGFLAYTSVTNLILRVSNLPFQMRHHDFCSFCLDSYFIIRHRDWFCGYFGFRLMSSVRKTAQVINFMQRIITGVEDMYGKKV